MANIWTSFRQGAGAVEVVPWSGIVVTMLAKLARFLDRFRSPLRSLPYSRSERPIALMEREALYKSSFEHAPVGMALIGEDGTCLRANRSACRIMGCSEKEVLGANFFEFADSAGFDGAYYADRLRKGAIDGYSLDKRHVRKDGTAVWVQIDVSAARGKAGAFNHFIAVIADVSERRAVETERREIEERLRLANEAAAIGTFTIDLLSDRARYSPALSENLGFPGLESSTVGEALARIHREDLPQVLDAYEVALRGLNAGPMRMDFRFVRPDGEVGWMTCVARVSFSDGTATRIVGACLNITEQNRREEKVKLLLSEVDHRAKNLLTLVQIIARRTAAASPGEFIVRFEERLRALAASQDVLMRSRWRDVDLKELVMSQLAHFRDLIGTRIVIEGPNVTISPAAAQTLAMAIHELATNAGKYGALSTDGGRIRVHWSLAQEDGAPATFSMEWKETDGPIVSAPSSGGFGSAVLTSLVKRGLDADVSIDYPPSGAIWRLRCPVRSLTN